MAIASIIGVAGAFASKPAHFTGTTYYAVTDDNGGYKWVTVRPSSTDFVCLSSSAYCTIVTNGVVPQPNQTPANSLLISHTTNHTQFFRR